ncbi:selenium cofactor biosynthesis protein YqeC [Agrilactobacillus yilanensis]|uniref:Selenium cofactor biosynthesis protein YqeC n=1 Tax=Agrilactobacillus yilanensis TaxID=2485997 RepID=A0ABW4J5C8_9LACO|nr:selenium cofactor biosynthesis protein YqeC [Agrilactobacillus yilanensis]
MRLVDCLALTDHAVIGIIGSGGKTTLMNYLAQCYQKQRVLMTTTTHILKPQPTEFDRFLMPEELTKPGLPGINVTGIATPTPIGEKLSGIDLAILQQALPNFDKVLIEADGANRKSLKAWRSGEPVLLPEMTTTIGVLPVHICGQPLTETLIHRLPLFLKYGPFVVGQPITPAVLAAVIQASTGLLAQLTPTRLLILNHVTDAQTLANAKAVVAAMEPKNRQLFDRIIAADTTTQWGEILWDSQSKTH